MESIQRTALNNTGQLLSLAIDHTVAPFLLLGTLLNRMESIQRTALNNTGQLLSFAVAPFLLGLCPAGRNLSRSAASNNTEVKIC